jgi:hypothetical protein
MIGRKDEEHVGCSTSGGRAVMRRLGYTVFEVVFAVVNVVFLCAAVLAVAWLVALAVLALSGLS